MVRHSRQLFETRLGGANGHFTIKLSAVCRDDLGAELLGQSNRQGCFACGRCASNDN